jgi:hypothetical protein
MQMSVSEHNARLLQWMQATHPGCADSSDESEEDTSLGLLSDSSLEEEKNSTIYTST